MGGTSADIWHYDGEVEKETQTKISDVFIKTMLKIDTIAAGGGSIAKYQNKRFVVGPESAGPILGQHVIEIMANHFNRLQFNTW